MTREEEDEAYAKLEASGGIGRHSRSTNKPKEAADHIEKLEADNARLRQFLSEAIDEITSHHGWDQDLVDRIDATLGRGE